MLARCAVLTVRSPIQRVGRHAFCSPPKFRRTLSPSFDSVSLFGALLCLGEPHAIVAAFLFCSRNEGHNGLRRLLSCSVSRSILLCACVAMVTPQGLWPPFVAQWLKTPREGRDSDLVSQSWRAFALALVKCIILAVNGSGDRGFFSFGLLCALSLLPSVKHGERLAFFLTESLEVSLKATVATCTITAADVATAFATCCLMCNEGKERGDAAWLRLWATVRASGGDALHPARARCYDLHFSLLLRSGQQHEVEALLCETIDAGLLHRISDTTLAQIFLVESLTPVMRSRTLAALLRACYAKSGLPELSSTLSPFERCRGLPSVTQSSTLFAKAMRFLVLEARGESSVEKCISAFYGIQRLCRMSNSHALAASLVPQDSSLELLMTASFDKRRSSLLATFVGALVEAMELACDVARRYDARDCAECIEATLQGCVGVLTGLLALCSSRRERLLRRRAEPEWRKRLNRETAVRSHKYELLCGELPHSLLTRCLSTLLANGFLHTACHLGGCLVVSDFVDLHYYTLTLLGSLYHAALFVNRHSGELDVIRALYFRRREVFGEDVFQLAQRVSGGEQSGHFSVLCDKALVTRGELGAAALGSVLQARSVVAAGGSIVIDPSFGAWLRKASLSVANYY